MSLKPPPIPDPESLKWAWRVNLACERHEAAWRAGQRPRIEDQILSGPDPNGPELLIELLAVEVELRREMGEEPTTKEYRDRFPGRCDAIDAAFAPPLVGEVPRAEEVATIAHVPGRKSFAEAGKSVGSIEPGGPGSDFGDFQLLEEIARGGMGIVFKARKRSLNSLVALKVLQAGALATESEKSRFLLEAEAAASLDHPNIVPVYEIDREHGLFFTMKWIDGEHLGKLVPRVIHDPKASARLLTLVARAVHAAHRRGYLHRDLKPANILIDSQGRPYVTDFGLARRVGKDSGLTQSGAIVGTPSYMAPEQAGGQGREVGPAADVYSLGAILYELLTGRPPFRAGTVMETLLQVLERDPTRPSQIRGGIPPELEAICLKCLEKDPAERYASAEALAEDLERALRSEEVQAMRAGPWLRLRRWTRREPQLVTRLIGLGIVEVLTQVNYLTSPRPIPRLHLAVTTTLAAWAIASVLLQIASRRDQIRSAVRPAWAAADVAFLTISLWLLEAVGTSMVVGYPLLVVASGLWFRVGLVWLATALAEVGYAVLLLDAWWRGTLWQTDHRPNIVMASILIAGFMVARQVNRLLVLSSYYENRLPS